MKHTNFNSPFVDLSEDGRIPFDIGDEGPQEPNDYLELHLNGFMPIGEYESFKDDNGEYYDSVVTDMDSAERPKFWITDEVWLEVDVGGIWEINSRFTEIRMDIDLYYDEDVVIGELHTVEKRFDGWVKVSILKEFIKEETNKFLSEWSSKFNSFKFTNKTWEGGD